MEGIVTKSTGSWYKVFTPAGEHVDCRIKGRFRLEGIKHTNPITVGDHVEFETEPGSDTGVIYAIKPRKNYIIRKASNLSKQTHIIAANMDQALLMVTLFSPVTSLGFIDRFLLTAEAYHIPAILVFNKTDLLETPVARTELDIRIGLYQERVGYTCLQTSVKEGMGLDDVKRVLQNKSTLISGHSGVGKSSLINRIEPALNLKTVSVSNHSQKGQHSTTFAEMHPLGFGGFIIDTPGIKEFGIVDIEDDELSHYFREMKPLIGQCKFNNCRHTNEPGCAVHQAVETGEISPERYKSYLSILANEDVFE